MEKFCDEIEHSNVQVVESEKTFSLDVSKGTDTNVTAPSSRSKVELCGSNEAKYCDLELNLKLPDNFEECTVLIQKLLKETVKSKERETTLQTKCEILETANMNLKDRNTFLEQENKSLEVNVKDATLRTVDTESLIIQKDKTIAELQNELSENHTIIENMNAKLSTLKKDTDDMKCKIDRQNILHKQTNDCLKKQMDILNEKLVVMNTSSVQQGKIIESMEKDKKQSSFYVTQYQNSIEKIHNTFEVVLSSKKTLTNRNRKERVLYIIEEFRKVANKFNPFKVEDVGSQDSGNGNQDDGNGSQDGGKLSQVGGNGSQDGV